MKKLLMLAALSNVVLATGFSNPMKFDKDYGGDDLYEISYHNEKENFNADFAYHMKANTVCITNYTKFDENGEIVFTLQAKDNFTTCLWKPIKPNHIAARGLDKVTSKRGYVYGVFYRSFKLNKL